MKTKPIRIAFDASPLLVNKTGIAYYIERVVSQLAAKYPEEIELVGFYYNFLGRRKSDNFPTAPNISYHEVKYIPSKVIYQLRRWNIEFPLELLVYKKVDFAFFDNFLGYPSLFKVPNAPVVHDLTYFDLPQYVSAKLRSDLSRFVPKTIERSDFTVTVSSFTKERIHEIYGVPTDDILVTPVPPVNPVMHSDEIRKAALHKMGIYKPFILTLGTVEPRKNVSKLIEAYKDLPQAVRDEYAFVIAGRIGWYSEADEAAIKNAAHEGYNVQHLGYVDEHDREILFQAATLFVCASHYEGFGMPILEAMSYGTPCAISNISVFHEVAGNAANYFDQEKSGIISSHLEALLTNKQLLTKLGKEGKAQAESFKWETIVTSIFDRIKRTIGEQD
jgi:glycosyltransferase involved in cell wall biosynthesis